MLAPAIIFKNQIMVEMQKLFYTKDMFYLTAGMSNWVPNISDAPDENTYQFAVIDNDRVVGYYDYRVDWYRSCAYSFGLVSFDKGNPTIGTDVYRSIHNIILDHRIHRIEFRMVGGNPVERHYDRLCRHFRGTKHILRDVIKDSRGRYHDDVIYEIITGDIRAGFGAKMDG